MESLQIQQNNFKVYPVMSGLSLFGSLCHDFYEYCKHFATSNCKCQLACWHCVRHKLQWCFYTSVVKVRKVEFMSDDERYFLFCHHKTTISEQIFLRNYYLACRRHWFVAELREIQLTLERAFDLSHFHLYMFFFQREDNLSAYQKF